MKINNQREKRLTADLEHFRPRMWKISLPGRHYTVRLEDMIPALAGVIGKISLTAAFAVAWAEGYQIESATFVAENVRLEVVIASVTLLLFSVFFHMRLAPQGTLAPMISLVPVMAAAGVHPLALGILFGLMTITLSVLKGFSRLVSLNDRGTSAGILILFGLMGVRGSISSLWNWTQREADFVFLMLLLSGGCLLCWFLYRYRQSWLMIPSVLAFGLIFSFINGFIPSFQTTPGFPLLNAHTWWETRWQIDASLNMSGWFRAAPFAVLAVLMLPLDASAIQTMQRRQYGPYFSKVSFKLDPTFFAVGLRHLIGVFFGGAQIGAVWRSFLIPLGVVRRPIPGSAFLLGIFCLIFAFAGYPIDLAMYPPLLHLVLVFGVFTPMLVTGWQTAINKADRVIIVICVLGGYFLHPLVGWGLGLLSGRWLKRMIPET